MSTLLPAFHAEEVGRNWYVAASRTSTVVALVFIASLKMKTIGVVGETPMARLAGTVEEISLTRRCLASRDQPHQRIA